MTRTQLSDYAWYGLKPFSRAPGNLYDSNMTKLVTEFGYKYDKTLPTTRSTATSQVRLSLRKMVNTQLSMTRAETAEFLPGQKTDNDLIINVRYNKFGFNNGEAYWVHFFIGEVGEPTGFWENPDRVGSIYNFSSPIETTGCQNCEQQKQAKILATGQIPITGAILKDWQNRDIAEFQTDGPFADHTIEKYLAQKLEWRVVRTTGELILTDSLPDLKVFVLLGDADHSHDVHVETTFGNYEELWGATAGKVGGGTAADL